MPQGPEFAFAPTPAEPPPAIKPENLPAVSSRPKPAPAPETSLNPEPPAPAPKIEDRHEPEPRRPAATIDSKPQVTTSTRTAPTQGGDYTIQVSSFRNMEQASELKGRLSKKGYAVYVQSVDLTDKGTWYRVRVGTYRDKGGAERVASDLRSRESLPATVMKR
jgi:cell division septation protein DedD